MRLRFLILTVLVILVFLANLFFGAVKIPPADIMDIVCGKGSNPAADFIVLGSRLPAAVTALLCGAALSVSGLLLQTAFRNPLAGPSILGISSGASLGVAVVMLFMGGVITAGGSVFGGQMALIGGALAGSVLIIGILIILSSLVKSDLMLLITGILVGYLTSSVVTLLSSISTAQGIRNYVSWGMGSFNDVTMTRLPFFAVVIAIGLAYSLTLIKPLNLLLLGDSYARNLGVGIRGMRNRLLVVTGLLTAVATAYCGPVAFIGMAVPHMARLMFRTDNHMVLLPASILIGSVVAMLCNVASTLPGNSVIPINALTPVIGVPVILFVILRRRG